ncbi:hypothetical protein [Methylobacterium sp. WL8]|uniref:hypothetical protein n=1 Tax=Methylobacterium sp. WL8 TaxID=2603899 RepID=UPI0011CBDD2D|nr:hypothetical protein [Methylobacterium sp. WL8]
MILTLSKRNRLPRTITGDGLILVAGANPISVRYEILLTKKSDRVLARGKIWCKNAQLLNLWLVPLLCLKLENSERIMISLTEIGKEFANITVVDLKARKPVLAYVE